MCFVQLNQVWIKHKKNVAYPSRGWCMAKQVELQMKCEKQCLPECCLPFRRLLRRLVRWQLLTREIFTISGTQGRRWCLISLRFYLKNAKTKPLCDSLDAFLLLDRFYGRLRAAPRMANERGPESFTKWKSDILFSFFFLWFKVTWFMVAFCCVSDNGWQMRIVSDM